MEKMQTYPEISGLKILIAEDDDPSDLLITIALEKIRLEFLHAKTGTEAVNACRSNPDIDLVLMDIKMPEMDGYEATRQIRQFNSKVIIIAQTAYALSGDREKAVEAGCNDYISKPIKNDELIELILKYF
jgi:CheY-like chemotaxis protein